MPATLAPNTAHEIALGAFMERAQAICGKSFTLLAGLNDALYNCAADGIDSRKTGRLYLDVVRKMAVKQLRAQEMVLGIETCSLDDAFTAYKLSVNDQINNAMSKGGWAKAK